MAITICSGLLYPTVWMDSTALWRQITAFFQDPENTLWGYSMTFISDEYERVFSYFFINLYIDFYIFVSFQNHRPGSPPSSLPSSTSVHSTLTTCKYSTCLYLIKSLTYNVKKSQTFFYSVPWYTSPHLSFSVSPYTSPPPSAAREWFLHCHPHDKNLQIGKNLEIFMVKTTHWLWGLRLTFFYICPSHLFPILLSFTFPFSPDPFLLQIFLFLFPPFCISFTQLSFSFFNALSSFFLWVGL